MYKREADFIFLFRDESFSQEVMSGQEIELDIRVKDVHTFHSTDLGLWTSSLWDLIRPPLVNSLDKWLPLEPEGSGQIHVKLDYQ